MFSDVKVGDPNFVVAPNSPPMIAVKKGNTKFEATGLYEAAAALGVIREMEAKNIYVPLIE